MTKFTKTIEVPMTDEEMAEAKKNEATTEQDAAFTFEFTRLCNEYAEKHNVSVFAAAKKVVQLNPKIGQQFLNYVYEQ